MAASKIYVSVICVYDLQVDNVGAASNTKFTGCTPDLQKVTLHKKDGGFLPAHTNQRRRSLIIKGQGGKILYYKYVA